jgi:hypothetical protein
MSRFCNMRRKETENKRTKKVGNTFFNKDIGIDKRVRLYTVCDRYIPIIILNEHDTGAG